MSPQIIKTSDKTISPQLTMTEIKSKIYKPLSISKCLLKHPSIISSEPRQGERHFSQNQSSRRKNSPRSRSNKMKRRQRSGSEIAVSKKPAAKPSSHQRDPKSEQCAVKRVLLEILSANRNVRTKRLSRENS